MNKLFINLILMIISVLVWVLSIAFLIGGMPIVGLIMNIICIEVFITLEIKRRTLKNE